MFLKYVKSKNKTYVYLMDYLPVEKRCYKKGGDRITVKSLGDLNNALIKLEIWSRHPDLIPSNIINEIKSEDLEFWINSIMNQNHIYNMYAHDRVDVL